MSIVGVVPPLEVILSAVPDTEVTVPDPTVAQSQVEVELSQASAWLSVQPRRRESPDENSRPEAEEVVDDKPFEIETNLGVREPPDTWSPLPVKSDIVSPLTVIPPVNVRIPVPTSMKNGEEDVVPPTAKSSEVEVK